MKISLIFSTISGYVLIAKATLVSGPIAIMVISCGRYNHEKKKSSQKTNKNYA